ncbi:MAG: hypothetical protein U5P41_06425 [Gammaproteobacteria bacterium]|nr:hypothetical protein [Gammaproteobacteria bacterium]
MTQLFARACRRTCHFLAGTPSPDDTARRDQGGRRWPETPGEEDYDSESPTIPRRHH